MIFLYKKKENVILNPLFMKLRSMYPRPLSAGLKSLKTKIIFSVITKNSNWEILTKNLVTFKR